MGKPPLDLHWIDKQKNSMVELLIQWVSINSGSGNLKGLSTMTSALEARFNSLNGTIKRIPLPPRTAIDVKGNSVLLPSADALHITKRRDAPVKIFLGGHMDTVYDPQHVFQAPEFINSAKLRGPGTADMKGGLIVMLTALEAFEMSPLANLLGWEIVINPDEEIGSVASEQLLIECAKRNDFGLIFEPSFSDGAIVGARKGSANFTLVVRGKAAHSGRDFDKGRDAIGAIANYIVKAQSLIDKEKGVTISFGQILGGEAANIVPDLAICRFNIRAQTLVDFEYVRNELIRLTIEGQSDGIALTLHSDSSRAPKPFEGKTIELFECLQKSAIQEEGHPLELRLSGGVCDGNILAKEGLPVIDTLGVIGGELHTSNEYVLLDSLTARARLTARLLADLALRS